MIIMVFKSKHSINLMQVYLKFELFSEISCLMLPLLTYSCSLFILVPFHLIKFSVLYIFRLIYYFSAISSFNILKFFLVFLYATFFLFSNLFKSYIFLFLYQILMLFHFFLFCFCLIILVIY